MSCDAIASLLFAYQFGEVSVEERAALEAHLLGCRACLGELLAIKREVETADSEAPASPAARQRLRHAVAQELGLESRPQPRIWWERPLAVAVAGLAVAAAVIVVQSAGSGPGRMPRTLAVDVSPGR